jgi:hypothetical protein
MSYDIIYQSRARIDENGLLVLEVKSYSNNVRPYPTASEKRTAEFFPLNAKFNTTDAEGIACYLESLAHSYAGGGLREGYRSVGGVEAYRLWSKRIKRVLPHLTIRPPRASKLVWGFSSPFKGEKNHIPAVNAGDALSVELAQALTTADVFPALQKGEGTFPSSLSPAKYYLAFVKDGEIYVAKRPGARRGWMARSPVLAKPLLARPARSAIKMVEDGTHAIRCSRAGEVVCFLTDQHEAYSPLYLSQAGRSYNKICYFNQDGAALAQERLNQSFPDARWEAVTRHEAELALAAAALINSDPPPLPVTEGTEARALAG